MTEVFEILADVPTTLAAAWAVWFGAGALLIMWYRKARLDGDLQPVAAARPVTRAAATPRPRAEARSTASGLQMSFDSQPESASYGTPTEYVAPVAAAAPVAPRRPKAAPVVVGDPFGDLATLLDQPGATAAPAPAPAPPQPHRTPGDSPILNSAGSPILRD